MASYNALWNEIRITQRPEYNNSLWRIGSNRRQHIDGMRALCSRLNIQEDQDELNWYIRWGDIGPHTVFVIANQSQIEQIVQYLNEMENNNATRFG